MTDAIVNEIYNWLLALLGIVGILGAICVIAVLLIFTYKRIKEIWHER
jgi:hypothetical protein